MSWKKSGIGLTNLTKVRGVSGTPSTLGSAVPARALKLRKKLPARQIEGIFLHQGSTIKK